MLDHLSIGTVDLARAVAFYDACLAPLGVVRVWTKPDAAGYGPPGSDDRIAIKQRTDARGGGPGFHVALTARTRDAVDAFHRAALVHGGSDQGGPGVRAHYGPSYYAAFVADPDGHHVEAVCHRPERPGPGRHPAGGD